MKNKKNGFVKRLGIYLLALSIPFFLVFAMVQSQQYMNIEKEVAELEQVQKDLIESNKALVTDISVLSSSERIEKIAVEQLGMRKATSDEIVRVSIKGK
ncbi:MAG: cell division protein FtsL [Spirochaetaceae bacterium]|jgi:cell division protein FtsL|nr:cell division protein FtsL [Spirochaetaceae bacterium]